MQTTLFDQHFDHDNRTPNDIINYIEMFYNSNRRHSYLGYLSSREFEKRMALKKAAFKMSFFTGPQQPAMQDISVQSLAETFYSLAA